MIKTVTQFLRRKIYQIDIFERDYYLNAPPEETTLEISGAKYAIGPFGKMDDATEALFRHGFARERVLKTGVELSDQLFEGLRQSKFVNCLKVFHDGVPVGFANFKMYDNEALDIKELSINYIYVHEDHRSLRLLRAVFDRIETIAKTNGCDAIMFGFDTGLELERKDKIARFMGFEKITPTYIKTYDPPRDQTPDNRLDKRYFGVSSMRQMGRATKLSRKSALRKFIPAILSYNTSVWLWGARFFEHAQEGYALALINYDLEQLAPFSDVMYIDTPTPQTMRAFDEWAEANRCVYTLIDTAYVDRDISHHHEAFLAAGYTILGAMYRKSLAPHAALAA